MRFLLSSILLVLLYGCSCSESTSSVDNNENTKEIDAIGELIERVHHCSKLEVTEYTILKTVSFDDKSIVNVVGIKASVPGERKLMIPIEVKIKVTIDLDLVKREDISIDSSSININLPLPNIEIYSTRIDYSKERESVSWFRSKFTEQEREKFIKQGIDDVKKYITTMEVTENAKRNTEEVMRPILLGSGMKKKVKVTFKSDQDIKSNFKD